MGAIAWVGTCHAMGGHRPLLMGVVWVWVQIQRKCWALFHTTLEGPLQYVYTTWMQRLRGFLRGIKWIKCHGHLDYYQNHFLEVSLTQNWETMAL